VSEFPQVSLDVIMAADQDQVKSITFGFDDYAQPDIYPEFEFIMIYLLEAESVRALT
jgi:hypothetical protein